MLRLTTERLFTQGGSSHLFGVLNCLIGMGREISVLQEVTRKVLLYKLRAERLVYELENMHHTDQHRTPSYF